MLYEELTRKIIGCGFETSNELGVGFLESVYEKALVVALTDVGLKARSQVPIGVSFRGRPVGEFFADIVVEEKVIVELKCAKLIAPIHEAQIINYLNATGIEVGMILNFGSPRLQYQRYTRRRGANLRDRLQNF